MGKVSVAMAVYNGEKFISEQLMSIMGQTHTVDEIVICDDHSTDLTRDVVNRYVQEYPDICWKVIWNQENIGFRKNFRQAIESCTGDLIFLCDQDDIWMENKVEEMSRVFDQNPDVKVLISDFKTIDANGRLLQPYKVLENITVSNRVMNRKEQCVKLKIYEAFPHSQGQGCTMAITKEIAKYYSDIKLEWAHDNLVGLIGAFRGGLYYLKEQLICYRLHENNTIGMPVGKFGERYNRVMDNLLTAAYVCKYCFFKKTGEECRKAIFNKEEKLFFDIEAVTGCAEAEQQDLAHWRSFEKKRLEAINEKKLLLYLCLRIRYREYFSLQVPIQTFEQQMVRFVMDLGAIVK